MDSEQERKMRLEGVPESDIEELRRMAEFLGFKKEVYEARDAGTLTQEMKSRYIQMIQDFEK